LGRAALSACAAAITMAAWLFIADITIVASFFGVAVGEGDTVARLYLAAEPPRCATEVSLTYYGARPRHRPQRDKCWTHGFARHFHIRLSTFVSLV
jgi:hypothetical protein